VTQSRQLGSASPVCRLPSASTRRRPAVGSPRLCAATSGRSLLLQTTKGWSRSPPEPKPHLACLSQPRASPSLRRQEQWRLRAIRREDSPSLKPLPPPISSSSPRQPHLILAPPPHQHHQDAGMGAMVRVRHPPGMIVICEFLSTCIV
jgi:hypothetical protein